MTILSVNINKVALLRNARGRNYPDVTEFSRRCLDLGAGGITLHPRSDQRHARYQDIRSLQALCAERGNELNVEGYPSEEFLNHVTAARPAQCTLVPDSPTQLTSDHGWEVVEHQEFLRGVIQRLHAHEIRVSLFIDFDSPAIELARELGADRIELYTEPFVVALETERAPDVLRGFIRAAQRAHQCGLGVNAGHDLSLETLESFLSVPHLQEVSIGHALITECLQNGLQTVLGHYLEILGQERIQTAG